MKEIDFKVPKIFHDLVIMRILEPASKLRSFQLLKKRFSINHRRQTFYELLPSFVEKKESIEKQAVQFAHTNLSFDYSLVLYDVTTLYFESFKEDKPNEHDEGLRKNGFSKDNKSQQPQIVISLLVTSDGFPVGYEVFRGNTFEGHTMLPVLQEFCKIHTIHKCTIVADAAMLSMENIEQLQSKGLSYIVGARIANLSPDILNRIDTELIREENASIRLKTKHGDLICTFSQKRFRKDQHDMEKQIARAERLISSCSEGRRAKFVQKQGGQYIFHQKLAEKTKKLLGIKGYITNIPESEMKNNEVVKHYKNLWKVEKAFRISKHDLATRPIFHYTENAIRGHVLICFMALAIGKYLEIATQCSLRTITDTLMDVTDVILCEENGKETRIRSELSNDACMILDKLCLSH